jgi:hypothetical protein
MMITLVLVKKRNDSALARWQHPSPPLLPIQLSKLAWQKLLLVMKRNGLLSDP